MTDYHAIARTDAVKYGVDPDTFERQIQQESGFNPDAYNAASGATGIGQIIPRFHPGVDPRDPIASLDYAARLMRSNVDAYGGYAFALIAYNWGPGNLAKWRANGANRANLPAETRRYLDVILGPGWPEPGAQPTVTVLALSSVLARARSRTGDPYVWGGKQPPSTDCSGFVAWCYDGKVTSFTDAIYDDTSRVETPAPGDIVLYQYADTDQPNVKFPHVALYLDDATVLDNRYGLGVGVHPQLARSRAQRYYRRLDGVAVDTLGDQPAPVPPPVPPATKPVDDEAGLRTKLSYVTHEVSSAIEKEINTLDSLLGNLQSGPINGSIGAARSAISTLRAHAPA